MDAPWVIFGPNFVGSINGTRAVPGVRKSHQKPPLGLLLGVKPDPWGSHGPYMVHVRVKTGIFRPKSMGEGVLVWVNSI